MLKALALLVLAYAFTKVISVQVQVGASEGREGNATPTKRRLGLPVDRPERRKEDLLR